MLVGRSCPPFFPSMFQGYLLVEQYALAHDPPLVGEGG